MAATAADSHGASLESTSQASISLARVFVKILVERSDDLYQSNEISE